MRGTCGRRVLRGAVVAATAAALVTGLGSVSARAAFPAANGQIAFVRGADVDALDASGSLSTLATGSPHNPAWSPDGSQVAYDDGGSIHFTGSGSTITGTEPAWRDTSTIAFTNAGDIWSSDTGGGSLTNLTVTAADDRDPAWSSNGSRIAYAEKVGPNYQIFVMNSDGSGQQQLTFTAADNYQPTWSPDSGTIAFVSERSGSPQIFGMDPNGGAQTRLSTGGGTATNPAFAPEGATIVFELAGSPLQTMSANGGASGAVTGSSAGDAEPDWQDAPPVNVSPPSISPGGATFAGETLSAGVGSWIGSPTGYHFQWQRCDAALATCTPVGSDSSEYIIHLEDVAPNRVRVLVQAVNIAGGSPFVASAATGGANGPAPVNVVLPQISGTPQANTGFLSVTAGQWTGIPPITFTYQWQRCDFLVPPQCDNIAATGTSFAPTAVEISKRLQVVVTATNSYGVGVAISPFSFVIEGIAPVNTISPKITGANIIGSVLSADTGTFTGSTPLTFAYQWLLCAPSGLPCNPIGGATASSYLIQANDFGSSIRVKVTAKNPAGSADGTSNHTFPIVRPTRAGPANASPPAIFGKARTRATLIADSGIWTGEPPLSYRYQWKQCDALGGDCSTIPGATKPKYKIKTADAGATLRVTITATNSLNTVATDSDSTNAIRLSPKLPKARRLIGTAGPDRLAGGGGNDYIDGRAGNDTLLGGAGDDTIYGGDGNDVIEGGPGSDKIFGGAGSDTIDAADGEPDTVDCGDGNDLVYADSFDTLKNCESRINGPPPS